ncbi:MAG TPA: tetratricopeptide repeat protein [Alphaproteobacteria bacterium]|nr:tetratricopeptide repeat protein [Alphaproteobacteria bacterium]
MKEPTTPKELLELHKVLRSDTQRYLQIANEWIRRNPRNSHAYFSRHHAWMEMGEPNRTLEDMNKAIALEPDPISYLSRGEIYRHLGEYQKAIEDFDLGEQLDPKGWQEDVLGLLYRADCHARLGDEAAALAYCARLPDDFWTPGVYDAPAGSKAEIADELRRIAAKARGRGP